MKFRTGDIFSPNRTGHEMVVCHPVNFKGEMEEGLALQIRTMFPMVYESNKRECGRTPYCKDMLGRTSFTPVKHNGYDYNIASLFVLCGFRSGKWSIDHHALRKALSSVRTMAMPLPARTLTTVRIPYKMGCELEDGDWDIVRQTIFDELEAYCIPVEIWKKDTV